MPNQITLLTTEIEKVMDALVAKQFTGGIIKIAVLEDKHVVIRDQNDFLVAQWTRPNEELVTG